MTLAECMKVYGCKVELTNFRSTQGFELANFQGGVVLYFRGTLLFVHTDREYADGALLGLVRLAEKQDIYELRLLEVITSRRTPRYRVEIIDQGLYTPDQPLTNLLTL